MNLRTKKIKLNVIAVINVVNTINRLISVRIVPLFSSTPCLDSTFFIFFTILYPLWEISFLNLGRISPTRSLCIGSCKTLDRVRHYPHTLTDLWWLSRRLQIDNIRGCEIRAKYLSTRLVFEYLFQFFDKKNRSFWVLLLGLDIGHPSMYLLNCHTNQT